MKWNDIKNEHVSYIERLKSLSPYERLGISKDAAMDEIKSAYRKKISLYHPDRADKFMLEYSQEIIKIFNDSMDVIKEERKK